MFVSYVRQLDSKAVATRRIPDIYEPKPSPYLNTNPKPNPNPTSPMFILCKDSRKDFTLHTVESVPKYFMDYVVLLFNDRIEFLPLDAMLARHVL